jgi:hypothetical protein
MNQCKVSFLVFSLICDTDVPLIPLRGQDTTQDRNRVGIASGDEDAME